MGKSKKDIIGLVYPESFKYKNRFGKFFTSFFGHTDELKIYLDKDPKVPFKIPFTFNKVDLKNAPKLGVKMAGFGPFFSGAVIVSIVLLVLLWKRMPDRQWRINMTRYPWHPAAVCFQCARSVVGQICTAALVVPAYYCVCIGTVTNKIGKMVKDQ